MSLAPSFDPPPYPSSRPAASPSISWFANSSCCTMPIISDPGSNIPVLPQSPHPSGSRPFFVDRAYSLSSTQSSPPPVDRSRQFPVSVRQQALQRVLKMKRLALPLSPLSPQESSVLSDAASFPSPGVESSRFSSGDGCVQSRRAYQGQDHASSPSRGDAQLSELPIVCGAGAFQMSGSDSRARNIGDGSCNLRMEDGRGLGIRGGEKETKRVKRIFEDLEDLERELLEDDADLPNSSVSGYDDAQPEPAKVDTVDRHWADVLEDLLAESSDSMRSSTVCSGSPTSDELSTNRSTNRSYTEMGASQTIAKNPLVSLGAGFAAALEHAPNRSLDVSVDSASQAKELLIACATAIADCKIEFARRIVAKLRQVVSIYGDPQQRLAAYLVEGLVARMDVSVQRLYKASQSNQLHSTDLLAATRILYQSCPSIKFGYMAANGAIAEACKHADKLHIVDFDIGQGNQWMLLIEALAIRPGGPPEVRITGVADPESKSTPAGGLQYVGKRLEDRAKLVGMPFQFNGLAMKVLDVLPSMVEARPGEALAVNFAFCLHRIPDESVCTTNPRDRLLRKVKSMEPKIVTLVERDANTNTAPFLPRFLETLSYYGALFESLDVSLQKESQERVNIEQYYMARDIVNIIAYEGAERVERYELAGKWRARMSMAGFRPSPISSHVKDTISPLLQSYSANYRLREEAGTLYCGWKNRDLIVASAWQ